MEHKSLICIQLICVQGLLFSLLNIRYQCLQQYQNDCIHIIAFIYVLWDRVYLENKVTT